MSDLKSSRTRIKICGIRTVEAALCAAAAGADAIGLVFVAQSPRGIGIEEARAITARLPAFVEPVALFADAAIDDVERICESAGIHTIQLHGHESPAYLEELGGLRIIKAVNFGDQSQSPWLASPPPGPARVAALLIDAPAGPRSMGLPEGASLTGGGGHTFNWAALDSLDRRALPPLILAGGLTPANVADAIAAVRPWAVDVSSGVESSRGVKDLALIEAFCRAVRGCDEKL